MKIKEVHTHMSVQFGHRKREHRFFTMDSNKFKGLKMELIDGLGVRIEDEEDIVIVPFVNITAIKVEKEEQVIPEPTAKERDVLGMNDNEPEAEEDSAPRFGLRK